FSVAKLNRETDVIATIHVPRGLDRDSPEWERAKIRYAAPFIDVVLSSRGHRFDFRLRLPDPDELHLLTDLQPVADLLLLLDDARRAGCDVEIEVHREAQLELSGRLEAGVAMVRPLVQWATWVHGAWTAAKFFDITRGLRVRLQDLAEERGPLTFMNVVLRPTPGFVRSEFSLDRELDPEEERLWCVPLAATARLGEYSVQVAAAAFGYPVLVGAPTDSPNYFFSTSDIRLEAYHRYLSPHAPERSSWELGELVAEKYAATMNVVLLRP
ncbi:MAG TPA: hypothetical protein VFS05_14515, partial [Gemmatimonadaceae bacterium]|nr:hypothetical protein [Gemmatimonadaceae bacterium]